jgi:GT2 family glycosyltransferase
VLCGQSPPQLIDVVVVDNSDKSEFRDGLKREMLAIALPTGFSVALVEVDNSGYFSGINSGLGSLNVEDYDFIVVGNNDLEFSDDFFNLLGDYQPAPSALVIAPNIVNLDGVNENPRAIKGVSAGRKLALRLYYQSYWVARLMTMIHVQLNGKRVKLRDQSARFIHLSMGACYILTREFLQKSPTLDSKVFLFGEEVVLAEQLRRLGGRLFYEPSLVVKHCEHTSVGELGGKAYYRIQQRSFAIIRKFL